MGMGEGARRIRMEAEEKQTSIVLAWCHLGTGTMGRDERRNGQRRGRETDYQRIDRSVEGSKMPGQKG